MINFNIFQHIRASLCSIYPEHTGYMHSVDIHHISIFLILLFYILYIQTFVNMLKSNSTSPCCGTKTNDHESVLPLVTSDILRNRCTPCLVYGSQDMRLPGITSSIGPQDTDTSASNCQSTHKATPLQEPLL